MGLCNSKLSAKPTVLLPESDPESPGNSHVPARDNSLLVHDSPKPHLSSVNDENPSNERHKEKNDHENGKK